MVKYFFLVLTVFLSTISIAQKDENQIFIGSYYFDKFTISETNNDLPSILNSSNKIEIRLNIIAGRSAPKYIVFAFNKKWTITVYEEDFKTYTYSSIFEKSDENLEKTFQKLVKNNIFSIQNNERDFGYLNINTNEIEESDFEVLCGVSYSLEFKVGNNFRRYSFSNPKVYLENQPSNHNFSDFNSIVIILTSEVKR